MAPLNTQQLDTTFELLTHPYRRYVLAHLSTESGQRDIDELATEIARRDTSVADLDTRIERVEIALRHTHLPKLANAGVIAVDANAECITLREADGVSRFLDQLVAVTDSTLPAATD